MTSCAQERWGMCLSARLKERKVRINNEKEVKTFNLVVRSTFHGMMLMPPTQVDVLSA